MELLDKISHATQPTRLEIMKESDSRNWWRYTYYIESEIYNNFNEKPQVQISYSSKWSELLCHL